VACTGVHGANRLASNSLLEGLVFGARAGHAMAEEAGGREEEKSASNGPVPNATFSPAAETLIQQVRDIMWRNVGVVRSGTTLKHAIQDLETMRESLPHPSNRRACELNNLHAVGLLIARSAIARLESRGAHYRTDYPDHDDVKFKKHSVVQGEKVGFE